MLNEFKAFAMRGNVVDLAIAVIIGAAFGKIVNSVIEDLIMPVIGKVVGNVDFSNLYFPLSDKIQKVNDQWPALADAKKLGPVFAYGNFITVLINFIILAFCIFLLVKGMNKVIKKAEAAPAAPTPTETLLTEIRDLLKNKS
ncbi:MAG TPA: large conductance mechanosensitive channel protein MscL [Verrucomicrobiae bacterium]|nr:large conductance mechanosensitive channel protein MscL [Verrucomicrobiae bacterium]